MTKTYSSYQLKKMSFLRKRAKMYYKQGFSLREVGNLLGKSHQWVAVVLKDGNWKKAKTPVYKSSSVAKKSSV